MDPAGYTIFYEEDGHMYSAHVIDNDYESAMKTIEKRKPNIRIRVVVKGEVYGPLFMV